MPEQIVIQPFAAPVEVPVCPVALATWDDLAVHAVELYHAQSIRDVLWHLRSVHPGACRAIEAARHRRVDYCNVRLLLESAGALRTQDRPELRSRRLALEAVLLTRPELLHQTERGLFAARGSLFPGMACSPATIGRAMRAVRRKLRP